MYGIPGLTSKITQRFINKICSESTSYLEVGSYIGATAVAALDGNKLDAYFVDNWNCPIQTMREDLGELPPNDKQTFIDNVKKYKGDNNIHLFDCDMFEVDKSDIKPIDVFFYDADHSYEMTAQAIQYYSSVFADECIVLIDDANFDGVVDGAQRGIELSGLKIKFERLILNDIEDASAWWNGIYIAIVNKP